MKKLNRQGFALVETLIVSVFVVGLFTLVYTNFFPLMGEYEKREGYDDTDSIYHTYEIKKMYEAAIKENSADKYNVNMKKTNIDNGKRYQTLFDYNAFGRDDISESCHETSITSIKWSNYCTKLFTELKVEKVYLTKYNLTELKQEIQAGGALSLDQGIQDYIASQPYYKKSNNGYQYRIIVKYVEERNKETEKGHKKFYKYATIGVDVE